MHPPRFSNLVGQPVAKKALLCTLVHPHLHGVLLLGPTGSGKSHLLRGFLDLCRQVAQKRRVEHLPLDPATWLENPTTAFLKDPPDSRAPRLGLFERARDGILLAENLSLHDRNRLGMIKQLLDSEERTLRFYATSTPEERELPFFVLDSIPLVVTLEVLAKEQVAQVLKETVAHRRTPRQTTAGHDTEDSEVARWIDHAQRTVTSVQWTDAELIDLARRGDRIAVSSVRSLLFAVRAAIAHASLRGSDRVATEDLDFAERVVLQPRATTEPNPEEPNPKEPDPEELEPEPTENDPRPERGDPNQSKDPGPEQNITPSSAPGRKTSPARDEPPGNAMPDTIFPATQAPGMTELFSQEADRQRTRHSGGGSSVAAWDRGGIAGAVSSRHRVCRIALVPTLLAAATRESLKPPSPQLARTPLRIRKEDLRFRRFQRRQGVLTILAVDASGSMAFRRMREAKAGAIELLRAAYLRRDAVAVLAVRGDRAETLLPPTTSIERAKRCLEVLPTGGGTPLASALVQITRLVVQERTRSERQARVVLITDGRANVPLGGSTGSAAVPKALRRERTRNELRGLAISFSEFRVPTVVVDSRPIFDPDESAADLARWLGARYGRIPTLTAPELVRVATGPST